MRRALRLAALAFFLAISCRAARPLSACPACAGDPEQGTPWAVVGGFLLAPIGVATFVALRVRRELSSRRDDQPASPHVDHPAR